MAWQVSQFLLALLRGEYSSAQRWRLVQRAFLLLLLLLPSAVQAERLKDLGSLFGARSNQLLGYGLVVGLPGTGDDFFSGVGMQSVATMLRRLSINVDPKKLRLRNVAAVMVTADLPAYAAPGQKIDIIVSSLGNARSLQGGTLLATPLKGADLKVYAVAQGPLTVGGFFVSGLTGSRIQKNLTTVGRVPDGALVEREVPMVMPERELIYNLHSPDFTTAVRISQVIASYLKEKTGLDLATPSALPAAASAPGPAEDQAKQPEATDEAKGDASPAAKTETPAELPSFIHARDSGSVVVPIPEGYRRNVAQLVAELEVLEVVPDTFAKVVVNERTGTVVLGEAVRLAPVAIAHGGLTLEIREQFAVTQPGPFSQGQTTIVPDTALAADEVTLPLHALAGGGNLAEVVKALNTLGVAPRDLVAILQALRAAGALRAELEVH